MLTNNRLAQLVGDWHEFESKALRKENERKDKEARKQAQIVAKTTAASGKSAVMIEKKRGPEEGVVVEREAKRVHVAAPATAEVAGVVSKVVEMTG